ncbi:MAG: hypothetical protein ABSH28_24605 [Acidobacteriota bacterium]|jgi:hypothetical protein
MKVITAPQKFISPQVESVRLRLERWRRNRKHRSPIPEELWASAAELAGEYGLAKTAHALRLDYYSLKERLGPNNQPIPPEAKTQPAFVELVPQDPAAISECTIELEDPSGARMRVHIKGTGVPDLTGLSDAFWRARR